jgi:two-component system, NtrC family, sensor kinase
MDIEKKQITLTWIYHLYRLGQKASSSAAVESAREEFLKHIISAFNADSGCLAQKNDDDKSLTIVAGIDIPKQAIGSQVQFGSAVLGWVAENKKPLLINGDIINDPDFNEIVKNRQKDDHTKNISNQSSMCWPLLVDNDLVGVISVNNKKEDELFAQNDLERGTNIIHFTALAVENARLHDRSYQLLSEQKQLNSKLEDAQNQLLQSDKMASIGQLAAGVAHEINNPVGYISSNIVTLGNYTNDILHLLDVYEENADPLLESTPDTLEKINQCKNDIDINFLKEDLKSLISESMEGISRVTKIVQDLKDFSHVDESEMHWSDIHHGIDSTLNIVSNEIKYKAEVIKKYGNLPEVECIASQINQVFMNMLVNAAHSIEEKGTITVETGINNSDWVWIKISDTGKGIDAENIKRIFDPFYTSKPVGEGTGLGLSLSYSIIEKHNGRIEVGSEVGKGTTFSIWLPVKQSAD